MSLSLFVRIMKIVVLWKSFPFWCEVDFLWFEGITIVKENISMASYGQFEFFPVKFHE